jgi:hypothetical protein
MLSDVLVWKRLSKWCASFDSLDSYGTKKQLQVSDRVAAEGEITVKEYARKVGLAYESLSSILLIACVSKPYKLSEQMLFLFVPVRKPFDQSSVLESFHNNRLPSMSDSNTISPFWSRKCKSLSTALRKARRLSSVCCIPHFSFTSLS